MVLIPLLGVTWLFGALSSTHKAFAFIFVIFNSTQVRCEPPSLHMHYSSIGKLTIGAAVFAIRHLHNSHKAPYLPPPPPPPPPPKKKQKKNKKLHNHFSWVLQPVPREIENNAYANFGGQIRCIMRDVHLVRGSNPYFSLKNKYLLQIKKLKEDMAKLEIISLKKAKDYLSTFFGKLW